jgi:hypothetical protein
MPDSPSTSVRPRRPKTGGRRKGTPNKSTAAIRDAMLQVFADLQAEGDRENGHFLDWARANSTDFYKLISKLLPRSMVIPEGGPAITHIVRTIVHPQQEGASES